MSYQILTASHAIPYGFHSTLQLERNGFTSRREEIKTVFVQFRTALAVVFLASVPLHLGASIERPSLEPLTSKEVRKAEASATTAADHLRLAVWYRSQAQQAQVNLAEQEALVSQLGHNPALVVRTKIPNAY